MLDKNTISQLSQLKAQIKASKEYATGTVASTNGRFGFVRLEDGRDAFLSPEKMQRVLPGDKVKVTLSKNKKDQLEANFEKLLESPLKRFIGKYHVKGAGHFVEPQGSHANRWIFVPPKHRLSSNEDDLVVAQITQHPYKSGKAQASITERIGQPEDSYFEYKYILAEYGIKRSTKNDLNQAASSIAQQIENEEFGTREDLTHLPFVTIDAASTKDMDDALALEELPNNGIKLVVAIADPGSFITPNSKLAKSAEEQGQTLYFLGGTIPMLPEDLANNCFSLIEGKKRPALVCTIEFDGDANIVNYGFTQAVIQSKFRLNYTAVAEFIEGKEGNEYANLPDNITNMLHRLNDWAIKRLNFRKQYFMVGNDQTSYDIRLNANGKISEVVPRVRTPSHSIVEEAMLSTNLCAGRLLQEHKVGIHTVHRGFREDRLGEVKALLKEEQIATNDDINTIDEHLRLLKFIEQQADKKPLLSPMRRMMQTSDLSLEVGPHLGLGLPHYATVTSPIRRFVDLYNHWAIYSIISDKKAPGCELPALTALQETLQNGRQADKALYQWLICQFTQNLLGYQGAGKVRIVTQQGFGVRLNEYGIDGFILFPKGKNKKYDAKRMTLEVEGVIYQLDTEVNVKISAVDTARRRIAFTLVTDTKSDKETSSETKVSSPQTDD